MKPFARVACLLTLTSSCSPDTFNSTDASDAAVNDVVFDVSGSPDSAPGDAGDAFPCASFSGTIFCDDFETFSTPEKGFTTSSATGGTWAFDTMHFVSPSRAVTFTAPTIAAGTPVSVGFGSMGSNVLTQSISLESEARIQQLDTNATTPIMTLAYAGAITGSSVDVEVWAMGGQFVLIGLNNSGPDAGKVPTTPYTLGSYINGKWYDIRVDLTTTPTVVATVHINGVGVLLNQTLTLPQSTDKIRSAYIGILYQAATSTPTSIDFDNFLFRTL